MFKFLKLRQISFAFVVCLLFSSQAYADEKLNLKLTYDGKTTTYNALPVYLIVNDEVITNLPMPPIIINDTTLVPVREVFEKLGAVVSWQASTSEIMIGYGNRAIAMYIDNPIANVDGLPYVMSVPPKNINNKTMIPLRFASEALGLDVNWDGKLRIVTVSEKNAVITPMPTPTQNSGIIQPISTPTTNTNVISVPTTDPGEVAKDISTQAITEKPFPETQILDVILPVDGGSTYTILASSEISKVEKKFLVEGNRIVIDIYNAEMNVVKNEWASDHSVINSIRIGQNQIAPTKITRVVFDLKLANTYSIALSPDRKSILVNFEKNYVDDINLTTENGEDYLTIQMRNPSSVTVFHLTNPDRVVIDVPSATLNKAFASDVKGAFTNKVRSGQFDENTARIVLELQKIVQHSVKVEGTKVIVKLSQPTFKNILYDGATQVISIAKGGLNISAASIIHTDNYNDKKYVLTIPADLKSSIGYGEYNVGDDYLRSIFIQNNTENLTQIILDERQILAVNITEDANNIYIKLLKPRDKYAKIVVIDAGHGGTDVGAKVDALQEKDINFDISRKIINLIERNGVVKVYATRTTDVFVPLSERAIFANEIADLFVSVHSNSGGKSTNAKGIETYYYDHPFDSVNGISSKQIAKLMFDNLIQALNASARKVDFGDFAVLRETTIPATLLEMGFITNPEEAQMLADENYRQKAAESIYGSILQTFEIYNPKR